MTFLERYNSETTWYGKVIVMGLYHLAMTQRERDWTITKTAESFGCSIGLVSENLRLAEAIHINEALIKIPSRQEALKRLGGRNESGSSKEHYRSGY